MQRLMLAAAVFALAAGPALAKDLAFWNQTTHEFSSVKLAPPGTGKWGAEQTDNDDDHAISADERLKITGIAPGTYDVQLIDKKGRVCVVRNVAVVGTGKVAFAIAEKQLTDCKP